MTAALLWVHDITGAQKIALRDCNDLQLDDRLQDAELLTFTIPADSDRAPYMIPDVLITYGTRRWRIATVEQTRGAAGSALIKIEAEARWVELARSALPGTTSILGKTITQGLTTILGASGWTVASVPVDATLYSAEDTDTTSLALLRRWAVITGNEVTFDTVNKTVTFVVAQGSNNGLGFRYGHNLVELKRRYQPPQATRLYAFGANNLDMTSVNPTGLNYIEDYSWYTAQGLTVAAARAEYRKDQIWFDDRYLLALNLYDAAVTRLAALAQPTITYECKVLDLYSLIGAGTPVGVGDTVIVRDDTFGLDLTTRVVRVVRNPNAPWLDEVELSFLERTIGNDSGIISGRTVDYSAIAILVATNTLATTVSSTVVNWASITYTIAGVSNVVMGGTFIGTCSGSGTVTIDIVDNVTNIGAVYSFPFNSATATQVEFSWPQFAAGLSEGSHVISWRARVSSGAGTIAIAASECRAWLLSQGAVGVGLNTSPNQSVEETFVQYLYAVSESITIDAFTTVDIYASASAPYYLQTVTTSGSITASAAPSTLTVTAIPSS